MIKDIHTAPTGYFYTSEKFDAKHDIIWLNHERVYDYNLGKPVKTVWGFFRLKDRKIISPVNAKKPGKQIAFINTTPYTAMPKPVCQ